MTGRRSIGEAIDPRRNSLNFLRLVLASMVLVSHAYYVGNFGGEGALNGTTFGTVAVYGFFGISGYLIAGSAMHNSTGRYLWQRGLRILPGFWVALIATAVIASLASPHATGPDGPFGFVWRNWLLRIVQPTIHGRAWNGSLWTLFYEVLCYFGVLGLGLAGALRRRTWALGFAVAVWLTVVVITFVPGQAQHFSVFEGWVWMNLLKLAAVFMVGAVVYLYRDRIPDSGWLAASCGAVFTASLWLPTGGLQPAYSFTDSVLLVPVIAYPLLWLGGHLPFHRIGRTNDYSYGVYVYAYPVTVLLAIWGANRWGYIPFAIFCLLGTIPFAAASWWVVEKRALRLRKVTRRRDPSKTTV
jgi:peptidoglycan/LPS O-acetylase OafA/YrhL